MEGYSSLEILKSEDLEHITQKLSTDLLMFLSKEIRTREKIEHLIIIYGEEIYQFVFHKKLQQN